MKHFTGQRYPLFWLSWVWTYSKSPNQQCERTEGLETTQSKINENKWIFHRSTYKLTKTATDSRRGNDARQLWRVWSNLDYDDIKCHPWCLNTELIWSGLHAVQVISATLLCRSHMSAVNYNTSPNHAGTLHVKRQQPLIFTDVFDFYFFKWSVSISAVTLA